MYQKKNGDVLAESDAPGPEPYIFYLALLTFFFFCGSPLILWACFYYCYLKHSLNSNDQYNDQYKLVLTYTIIAN